MSRKQKIIAALGLVMLILALAGCRGEVAPQPEAEVEEVVEVVEPGKEDEPVVKPTAVSFILPTPQLPIDPILASSDCLSATIEEVAYYRGVVVDQLEFVAVRRATNTGSCAWPEDTIMVAAGGDDWPSGDVMMGPTALPIGSLPPGESMTILIPLSRPDFISWWGRLPSGMAFIPANYGWSRLRIYLADWYRLQANGILFGEDIEVHLSFTESIYRLRQARQ